MSEEESKFLRNYGILVYPQVHMLSYSKGRNCFTGGWFRGDRSVFMTDQGGKKKGIDRYSVFDTNKLRLHCTILSSYVNGEIRNEINILKVLHSLPLRKQNEQ